MTDVVAPHNLNPTPRDLLAPVYGWFSEGFDTRDLKEARALLEIPTTRQLRPRQDSQEALHLVIRRISLVSEQARMGRMLRDEHL